MSILKNFRAKRNMFAASLICVLVGIFASQLIHVARLYSVNWDESHHLYDGYLILT